MRFQKILKIKFPFNKELIKLSKNIKKMFKKLKMI